MRELSHSRVKPTNFIGLVARARVDRCRFDASPSEGTDARTYRIASKACRVNLSTSRLRVHSVNFYNLSEIFV